MRIALVDESFQTSEAGGAEILTQQLSNALKENKIEHTIFSYNNRIKVRIPTRIRNFPYLREALIFPYVGFKLIPKIEREEYGAVHFASISTSAFRKANVCTITYANCLFSRQTMIFQRELPWRYFPFFNPLTYAFYRQLEIKSLNNVDYILAAREDVKNFLINELKQPAEKVYIQPSGVNTKLFKPIEKKASDERIVLFVGRGTIAKGFNVVLGAADYIEGEVVVVAQRIANYYQRIARTKKNVRIIPRLNHPELAQLYQKASVFVLPSIVETGGPPITTMEAMACGLPIVCTSEGGGGKIINYKNGFVVPNRDPKTFAEKVNLLLQDKNMATEFGLENRRIVEENYALPIVNATFVNFYRSILGCEFM